MATPNGGFLISQIKQIQSRVFDRILLESGIEEFNGAQGRILFILWQEDNLPIATLAKKTGLAKNTLTAMLDRMEQAGHIIRSPDKTDRRQTRICLTKSAIKMQEKYNTVSNKMNELFYNGFTAKEITSFENMLKRILTNLE